LVARLRGLADDLSASVAALDPTTRSLVLPQVENLRLISRALASLIPDHQEHAELDLSAMAFRSEAIEATLSLYLADLEGRPDLSISLSTLLELSQLLTLSLQRAAHAAAQAED